MMGKGRPERPAPVDPGERECHRHGQGRGLGDRRPAGVDAPHDHRENDGRRCKARQAPDPLAPRHVAKLGRDQVRSGQGDHHDGRHEGQAPQDAGHHAGGVQLADGGVRHHAVHDERDAGRDEVAELEFNV
jgi:hypothetical protein